MEYAEIAEQLGVSESIIRNIAHHARKRVARKHLEERLWVVAYVRMALNEAWRDLREIQSTLPLDDDGAAELLADLLLRHFIREDRKNVCMRCISIECRPEKWVYQL